MTCRFIIVKIYNYIIYIHCLNENNLNLLLINSSSMSYLKDVFAVFTQFLMKLPQDFVEK